MKLPEEIFQAIVGCASVQIDRGKNSERRRNTRIRHAWRVHVIPMAQKMAANPINAQVRDISREGIGLLLPRKLTIGDNLLIRLQSKQTVLWVFCDVARVEKVAPDLYVTGATYNRAVTPLPVAEAVA